MSLLSIPSQFILEEGINDHASRKIGVVTRKVDKKKYILLQYTQKTLIEINEIRMFYALKYNDHLIHAKEISYDSDSKAYNCIVDYASDQTLHHYIIQNIQRCSEEKIWEILIQILYGVLYLHNNGIIHRNIKTSNIYLLDNCTSVKLGGFKICEINNEKNGLKNLAASLNYFYAAPEIIHNEKYDLSSDIWSIGACLYEMCFMSSDYNQPDIYFNLLKGVQAPIHESYSNDLSNLINTMMSLKKAKRPTCLQLLNNPIVLRHVTNIHYHINSISQANEGINKVPLLEQIHKDKIIVQLIKREYMTHNNIDHNESSSKLVKPNHVKVTANKIEAVSRQPLARNNSAQKKSILRSNKDYPSSTKNSVEIKYFTKKIGDLDTLRSYENNNSQLCFKKSLKQFHSMKLASPNSEQMKSTSIYFSPKRMNNIK